MSFINNLAKRFKVSRGTATFLTSGVPMILLILGGSYCVSLFMDTHYEVKDSQNKSVSIRQFDLEEEHKKMQAKLKIDDYKLSRIPRPVDEGK